MTIPTDFDAIFSLGYNCQVAAQLRRNRLRNEAGPWDWFSFASSLDFCMVLRNQFSGFMLLENLEVFGTEECYYVRDNHTSCLSFHDFRNNPNEKPLYDYPAFRAMLDRRIERFNQCLNSNQKILLIRIILHEQDAEMIYQTIRETYPNPNISLLFVILQDAPHIVQLPSFSTQVRILHIPNGTTWEGDMKAWKSILQGFSLRSKK